MSGTPRYRVIVAAKLLLVGRPFATVCDTHGRCFSIRSMAMSALTCYFARPRNAWSVCTACIAYRSEGCAVHAMHVLLAAHGMRAILAHRVMRALRALRALYGVHAERRVRAEVAPLAVRAEHAMRCMCSVLS